MARIALAQFALRIPGGWGVAAGEGNRPIALGSARSKRHMMRSRFGNLLPGEPGVWARAVLPVERENALNRLIPLSAFSTDPWITAPRVIFGRKSKPFALMPGGGLDAIRSVAHSLDNPEWH